jgi:hypothetical protein
MIEPDPHFEEELMRARISTSGWKTDFRYHVVPYKEVLSGGVPRDGIPPIDNPDFVSVDEASAWLEDQEPVVSVEIHGEAKAYPLQILTRHEIVNDVVGAVPVAVTFCPLCNSAIVFDRRLDGRLFDFGVSGFLSRSDLIMWDRQTQSWWQQLTGEAIVGELAGSQLILLASAIISWNDFRAAHPDGLVLSRDTGFNRVYGQNPYAGYDRADNPPFLFRGNPDRRLLPKERVVALTINGVAAAFPYATLKQQRVVHYTVGEQDLVVFFKPGTRSALDKPVIADSTAVGATGVFATSFEGRKLTFHDDGEAFVDSETGSVWTILGEAIDGSLKGGRLTPIVHADPFWFSWAAFKPDTLIYNG